MKRWFVCALVAVTWVAARPARPAEITEVLDAADGDDPIDINIDIGFRSILTRSKITHEWKDLWSNPTYFDRPDFNELRFERQVYAMDYTIEIGLYHDVQLYAVLPWIISDVKQINFVSGVSNATSTLYRAPANQGPDWPGNALAVDPTNNPESKRAGIGDMQIGAKWALFNGERDDTKSVWIIGLDFQIPSGGLARPEQVAGGGEGDVGLGQFVLTPFMLFSHRFSVLDPYVGIHGSIPIQGREAANAGFVAPYHGGFLTGMEIIPWEDRVKHQKFAIDLKLTAEYFGEVESNGESDSQGFVNELSDFLVSPSTLNGQRQLQAMSNYAQFGLHLGFVFRAAEFVRFRCGVSLAHNSEHFITGADACEDNTGDNRCDDPADQLNEYRAPIYDDPGRRLRVEETTLFTWWVMGMLTF